MKRRHLVFDLDDTLVPSTEAYGVALRALGAEYDEASFQTARRDVKAALGSQPAARNRWLYFKRMLELRGVYSPARLRAMATRYEDALHAHLTERWAELGRAEFCERLKRVATPSLITNENTRTQILKLNAVDPNATTFATVVTSEEVGFDKPSPEIFEALHRRLGAPDPTDVVMIGDDLVNDIQPALALGWTAVLTTEFTPAPHDIPPGVRTVARLDDLFDTLELR